MPAISFKAIQSAPDLATALARADHFLATSPEQLQTISLSGI
jgi:hypothetical protein